MRHIKLVIVAAILLVLGCSNEQVDIGNLVNIAEQKTDKEKLVLWSYYETEVQQRGLDELVSKFNLSQDTYEASWEYHGPVTEFNKQLAIAINEKQLPDMVIIDNPDMRSYVELGLFEDLTSEIIKIEGWDEYYPSVLGSVIYEDKYYGVPFCCNNVGLFYNKDILNVAGIEPPSNWQEFKVAANELTTEKRYGFAMSAISGEQSTFQILPWILSAGESMENLGGSNTAKAYELISELVEVGSLSKDCINWSQNDVARKFISGESAMMENGPWVLSAVMDSDINYGIVRLPVDNKNVSVAGGENIGVLKGKNIKGTLELIKFYNQDEIMLKICKQSNALPPKMTLAEKLIETNPEYTIFVKQMETCISRSSYKFWPVITKSLSEGLFEVIIGESTPEEVTKNIQEQMK